MFKMGLHCPFGHLKHKLWPKEGSRVKLPIWLPTTKSRESTQIPYVQIMCNIPLKSSRWGLQFCFGPHCNRRSTHEVMGFQSHGSPNGGNFGTPTWESHDKKDVAFVERCKVYYKGEGGGSPQVRPMVSLVSLSYMWLILAPKVLQVCTNHLVLVLWRSMWVIEACQFFLVPSQSSSTPLYPSKVLWAREHAPIPYPFVVLNLDSHSSPLRSWECVKFAFNC
jgi:hypothetical protein